MTWAQSTLRNWGSNIFLKWGREKINLINEKWSYEIETYIFRKKKVWTCQQSYNAHVLRPCWPIKSDRSQWLGHTVAINCIILHEMAIRASLSLGPVHRIMVDISTKNIFLKEDFQSIYLSVNVSLKTIVAKILVRVKVRT